MPLSRKDIMALTEGRHHDPFAVLGCQPEGDHWQIRAFLPQATGAFLLHNGQRIPMRSLRNSRVYAADCPSIPLGYRLLAADDNGRLEEFHDPYRFPLQISEHDLHLHAEGTLAEAYRTLGAHLVTSEGVPGVRFAVWAPGAESVSLTGDFNHWDPCRHPMRRRTAGIWEIFLPGLGEGARYKYSVRAHGHFQLKADPYAFAAELPPDTASIVANPHGYQWNDQDWLRDRGRRRWLDEPVSIYEIHPASWQRHSDGALLNWSELADRLLPYVQDMGFTHVELLPITEHPYSGSWGYQVTGFFAPTARFGPPAEFKRFVDRFHQAGIGIILDWVPGHFPKDAHGLALFDGTALYEHADPRQGEHLDWGTLIFNYGRNEVRTFLLASALFWLREYHLDGLRVDAVASMLYLDYSRQPGQWIPNKHGGRENLDAISFLRRFNELAHEVPGVMTIAEESTSFPLTSRPVYLGGLGFTMKWNMGWMHDMFAYFKLDPVHRKHGHQHITFSLWYAFNENYVLPISHDEVVHMKGSLIERMPGDEWQRFANTRAFLAYMFTHPGKKLLFMGCEFGQYEEWNHEGTLRWFLMQYGFHAGLRALVRELNRLHRAEPAFHQVDFEPAGFEWIDFRDLDASVIAFIRRGRDPLEQIVVVCNFTPVPRYDYRIGMPAPGRYLPLLNTDEDRFGGSNIQVAASVTEDVPSHGRPSSIALTLPPLAVLAFKWLRSEPLPPRKMGEDDRSSGPRQED
ncbi:MAG: 1,4-alpha-glucan branching protein GlgB [Acidobacteria bacterium]|nr:1,4-alpha-glucan branching protein GlgB [Acidobacteriota bacterium]